MDKRLYWIDWAKFFAITFVVWGHISTNFINEIYMFHIPLFFMISGYLYRQKEKKEELKNILFSLFIPYLIYNFIYLFPITGGEFKLSHIYNILLGNQEALTGIMIPLWFIVVLILIRLLCATHFNIYIIASISFILSIIMFEWIQIDQTNDYLQLKSLTLSMPFFGAGQWLKRSYIMESICSKWNRFLILAISIFLFVGFFYLGNIISPLNHLDIFNCYIGSNILLFYLITFSLAFLFLILCRTLLNYHSNIITTYSNGTLLILGIHLMIFWKIPKISVTSIIYSFISLSIILFISFYLIYLSEKYCPILIGKKK